MNDVPALRMEPPPFAADQDLALIWDALPTARVVGGAVRDAVAGRRVADIDLATPLPPDAVTAALANAGLRAVPTGLDHGTVTALSGGRGFEITTLRHDLETDGRHAVVAFTADWREDALRRDFTINALSLARDGAVFDYFGGLVDLRDGRVRFVGNPNERIQEDYLRILRFFRFQARYGRAPPDPETLTAIRAGIHDLDSLSVERIWSELYRILAAPDPVAVVDLMADLGALAAVVPELSRRAGLARLRDTGAPADPILRVAAMLAGDPIAFSQRLKLSNEERDRLVRLQTTPLSRVADDDATLRRYLAEFQRADLIDRIWLDGDPGTEGESSAKTVRQRLARMPQPIFPLEGRDVVVRGVAPGPQVGALLRALRQWWMDGGCVSDRSACEAELARRTCAAR